MIIQNKKESKKLNEQKEAQQMFQEINDFEKRNNGKAYKTTQTKSPEPREEHQLSEKIICKPPSPIQFYDIYQTKSNHQFSTKDKTTHKYEPRAGSFSILDEPILPSHAFNSYHFEYLKKPFYYTTKCQDKNGIPVLDKTLRDSNERKRAVFNSVVNSKLESEKKKEQKELQRMSLKNRESIQQKREKTNQMYIKTGQNWVYKKPLNVQPKNVITNEQKLSEEDIEAINHMNKRDEEIMNEIKEKKSQEMFNIQYTKN